MAEMITVTGTSSTDAYLARPDGAPKAGVIVIHEVWGLDDHIKSVADRLAKQGYLALAPDFFDRSELDLPRIRGMKLDLFDPKKRNEAQPILRELTTPLQNPEFGKQTVMALSECFNYLYDLKEVKQRVAVMGFCFGGTYSFNLAASEPRLKAAIAFYGYADQDVQTLKQVECPILALYGQNDERLISSLDDVKDRMAQAGVDFTAKVYPNCGHAFFNDSNSYAYNQAAAEDAWQLTLDRLSKI